MIRILTTLILTVVCATATARQHNGGVCYQRSDSLKVVALLKEGVSQPAGTNMPIFFARKFKGTPYVAHTLEVNKTERLVVNLRQLDCTTLVENVVALCLCVKQKRLTFNDFCAILRQIRYRGGSEPTYTSRLHYFTEWITDNTDMGFCKELQTPVPPFSGIQKVNVFYMSTNPDKYSMLKGDTAAIKAIAKTERSVSGHAYRYIPKGRIANTKQLRAAIHDGDIIATTTTLKGLDIQHLGFAVWKKDGLHMLNASSLRHKVVEETLTLRSYLNRQKTMSGVRIVRINY